MPVATDAREPKGGIGPSAREKPLQEAWCHIRRLQDPLDRACREVRSCDPAMPRGYPRNKSRYIASSKSFCRRISDEQTDLYERRCGRHDDVGMQVFIAGAPARQEDGRCLS